ncbi:YncE family protein [Corynebacterium sp. CCM 9204]|uniref:YncE family protein n=1 Tax=Corynebacterium sp. CCM 9204 TaxID=3057616 RepID=UPI003524440B
MSNRRRFPLTAVFAVAAVTLSACNAPSPTDGSSLPELSGATVVDSPPAENPEGEVFRPAGVLAGENLIDLAVADGDVLAVRSESHLGVGTLRQLQNGGFTAVDVAAECGPLSARESRFVLACPDGSGGGVIHVIDVDSPDQSGTVKVSAPVTTAALTGDGRILAGFADAGDVLVLKPDGSGAADITADIRIKDSVDQLVTVPVDGQADRAVLIDRGNIVISGVDWTNAKPGAALRAGLGVGRMAVGEPGTGVLFASDTRGGQLLVYTTSPVIMLHQMAPAGTSPWALTWDPDNHVVWVSDTADNVITAYSVAGGVPVATGTVRSVAGVRGLSITDSGELVAVSASGDGIQVVGADTLIATVGGTASP